MTDIVTLVAQTGTMWVIICPSKWAEDFIPLTAATSRGSVQQGLSVAGGALDFFQLGLATDKRYSLAVMETPGTRFPFEFCALRFLIQWRRNEQYFHRHLRAKPTIAHLRSALKYFQVARNFKDLGKDEKATMVLRAFSDIQDREDLGPEDKVTTLAERFKDDGFQHNLSAASKLLWLKSRRPFVIYDSRAVTALTEHFGRDVGSKNYHKYCEVWREEYERHVGKIEKAVDQLQHVRDFMPAWRMSNATLLRMARRPWFKERVFDIYLWELGGDG